MTSQQSQHTQTQTQAGHEYTMYDQSFDISATVARLISTCNVARFQNITISRKEPGHLYKFGRHKTCDFILPGIRFSNCHFTITEQCSTTSKYGEQTRVVIVEDTSTNGTFLNQARIGKGQTTVLCNGDELAVGLGVPEDEVRYLVQLPKRARPRHAANLTAEAIACMEKYDIRETLGAGAFATVKIAVDRTTGIKYAVKILNQQKLAITNVSSKATELFKREIEILQSTKHPNIVQYVDMWVDDTDIYLVLEYLPGGDLMDCIMRVGRLSEYHTAKIIQQILEALVYCHKLGIAHRDIKPENILLTHDNPPIVKLTDFGLAKMVVPGSFLKTFCGTLTYVAPEVISMDQRVQGSYSSAVDMWSIGCVTFVMLAGCMPFPVAADAGQDAMMKAIQNGQWDDGKLDEIELSGAGVDFIESLLRLEPSKRMTGPQALAHPWLTEIDRDQAGYDAEEMDHDSQDNRSQEVQQLQVAGDSVFAVPQHSPSMSRSQQHNMNAPRTPVRTGYGLFDESSVDWSQVEGGRGLHFQPAEKQAYLSHIHAQSKVDNSLWNTSHFSADSSPNFLGSSKYVSAASHPRTNDSSATITPQRLKDARDASVAVQQSAYSGSQVPANEFSSQNSPH